GARNGALWRNGQIIELGPNTNSLEAVHINNLGQVVGYYYDGFGSHPFVWQDANANGVSDPSELVDLMTRVPQGSLTSFNAIAINDAQQIVGFGYLPTNPGTNNGHAIMLTPSSVIITTDKLPDGSVGDGYSAALAAAF